MEPRSSKPEVPPVPAIATFFGIIVRMYREHGGKHHLPHIHAEYSGEEVAVGLDGTVLGGSIPRAKMKLLEAWMEIHREDLEADWALLTAGDQPFKIDPLR
jgi:hypothetical protein